MLCCSQQCLTGIIQNSNCKLHRLALGASSPLYAPTDLQCTLQRVCMYATCLYVCNCRALIASINDGNPSRSIHPDFASTTDTGAGLIPDGIPFITVDSNPAKSQQFPPGPTVFNMYPTESDVTAGESLADSGT